MPPRRFNTQDSNDEDDELASGYDAPSTPFHNKVKPGLSKDPTHLRGEASTSTVVSARGTRQRTAAGASTSTISSVAEMSSRKNGGTIPRTNGRSGGSFASSSQAGPSNVARLNSTKQGGNRRTTPQAETQSSRPQRKAPQNTMEIIEGSSGEDVDMQIDDDLDDAVQEIEQVQEEEEEEDDGEGEMDVVEVAAPPTKRSRQANSTQSQRDKRKVKATTLTSTVPSITAVPNSKHSAGEAPSQHPKTKLRGITTLPDQKLDAGGSGKLSKNTTVREVRLQKELDRMGKLLKDVTSQRDMLAQQLTELHHLRYTDAEEALQVQSQQYEARIQSQEEMIKELTTSLAHADSLSAQGKTSSLPFLTREAADEERRGLENELAQSKAVLKAKERTIAETQQKVSSLESELQITRKDLELEIERSNKLNASTRPQPTSRTANITNPKGATAQTIALYEKLTDLLVLAVKIEPPALKESKTEETVFTCLYTVADFSLTFSLRTYEDTNERGDLVGKCLYAPLDLDKLQSDLVAKLDFLAEPFNFDSTQIGVFLNSLKSMIEKQVMDLPDGEE